MSNLEKRVYESWAFTEDELEKRNINSLIYKELSEKYKISHSSRQYNSTLKGMEDVKLDDYDIVLDRTSCYGYSKYRIVKNNTDLSRDELALICDRGNLCFGYRMEGSSICVFEDWVKGAE